MVDLEVLRRNTLALLSGGDEVLIRLWFPVESLLMDEMNMVHGWCQHLVFNGTHPRTGETLPPEAVAVAAQALVRFQQSHAVG